MTEPTEPTEPTQQPGTPPTGRTLRAVVLLAQEPGSLAEVLGAFFPDAAAAIGDLPLRQMGLNVNGVPMTFEIGAGPLVARELDYAVSQSPLRARVEDAVARHRGHLILSADDVADVFRASELLSNVVATYADGPDGLAVWLPDADHVTTDVMYVGEVSERMALTWFSAMAARLDATTALAHTIGVRHLGGWDVQLRSTTLTPADAHRELRAAVATLLEGETLPAPGAAVVIAGQPHVLTPAPSVLGLGDVLDAVATGAPAAATPAAAAGPEEEKPRRKGWFSRR